MAFIDLTVHAHAVGPTHCYLLGKSMMRSVRLQFEAKLALIFGSVTLFVLFMGAGNLSFDEAKSKADEDETSLSSSQFSKLVKTRAKFAEAAFPPCIKATGTVPDDFTIVIEIGSDGYVTRSWRQGDTKFVICFQKSMTDNFVFRSVEQPFFTSFEYTNAS